MGTALSTLIATSPTGAEEGVRSPLSILPCGGHTCVVARLPDTLVGKADRRTITERDWRSAFPVRTAEAAAATPRGPGLFGAYELRGLALVFEPRLPFLPDREYVATLRGDALVRLLDPDRSSKRTAGIDDVELRFVLPAPAREPPRVLAIRPTSPIVPANLLRAYVELSVPMRTDVAAEYVHLEDDRGERVPMAFVEIDGGLWDPRGTRLTLLFHPGRIKRGVAPRQLLGSPLEEGRTYRLVVEAGWPGSTGEPLVDATVRTWTVGPADRTRVDPRRWTLETPSMHTTEPLRIRFGEPLDHALASRLVTVLREGEPLAGRPELLSDGTEWWFHPATPWTDATHLVRVSAALEDLAGNNLRGRFDRGRGEAEVDLADATVTLPFRPRDARDRDHPAGPVDGSARSQ